MPASSWLTSSAASACSCAGWRPREHVQVRQQRPRHLGDALGEEGALAVDVDGLAAEPAEGLGHVHVDRELHAQLRLADAGHARKLGELTQGDAAAQQQVEVLDEGGEVHRRALLVEELSRRLGHRRVARLRRAAAPHLR